MPTPSPPRKRALRIALVAGLALLGLAVAFGLRGWWGGKRPTTPGSDAAHFFPKACGIALEIPSLTRAGAAAAWLTRLKAFQYMVSDEALTELSYALTRQRIRIDREPDRALEAIGIDPAGGLFAHLDRNQRVIALLPVADFELIETTLRGVVARGRAVDEGPSTQVAGRAVRVFIDAAQKTPLAALTRIDQGLLVALGPQPLEGLTEALGRTESTSLAADEGYRSARERQRGRDLGLYVCPGAQFMANLDLPYGLALAARFDPKAEKPALGVDFALPLAEATAKGLKPHLPAEPLGARLDPNAFATARFHGDPTFLRPLVEELLPRSLLSGLQTAGLDLKSEIFDNLQPGLFASLALPPTLNLERMPDLNSRATNPFHYLRFEGLARLDDPAKAETALGKLDLLAPRIHATTERQVIESIPVLTFRYRLGEGLSLAVTRGTLAIAGGEGAMARLLSGLTAPAAAVPPLPQPELLRVTLEVSRLVAGLRALPDSAFGLGGFAIKAGMERILELVMETPSLDLSATLDGSTLVGRLTLPIVLSPSAPLPRDDP